MISKSVLLPLPIEQAFALFTDEISAWWPANRRHLDDPQSELLLLESGRFFERASDGTELDLGRVRLWERPHRIVLDFFMGTDAAHPTEVEITFVAEGDATRVSLTHRPQPGSAELWDKRSPAFDRSWDAVLLALERAATKP